MQVTHTFPSKTPNLRRDSLWRYFLFLKTCTRKKEGNFICIFMLTIWYKTSTILYKLLKNVFSLIRLGVSLFIMSNVKLQSLSITKLSLVINNFKIHIIQVTNILGPKFPLIVYTSRNTLLIL